MELHSGSESSSRSYPASEVRGGTREEQPHARGQVQWQGGPTPHPRIVAARAQEGLEELSHVEGQEGRPEEISPVQSKEQRLRFAGVAMKRYATPKVRET